MCIARVEILIDILLRCVEQATLLLLMFRMLLEVLLSMDNVYVDVCILLLGFDNLM